ncbi:hypothetical protein NL676_022081 [Syzygium grande]|nr:hypothetical protein NL676_022081 [Syzygium grande]
MYPHRGQLGVALFAPELDSLRRRPLGVDRGFGPTEVASSKIQKAAQLKESSRQGRGRRSQRPMKDASARLAGGDRWRLAGWGRYIWEEDISRSIECSICQRISSGET